MKIFLEKRENEKNETNSLFHSNIFCYCFAKYAAKYIYKSGQDKNVSYKEYFNLKTVKSQILNLTMRSLSLSLSETKIFMRLFSKMKL